MVILGITLLIVCFIAKIAIAWMTGIIGVVIGAILPIPGFAGHAVGGRGHDF